MDVKMFEGEEKKIYQKLMHHGSGFDIRYMAEQFLHMQDDILKNVVDLKFDIDEEALYWLHDQLLSETSKNDFLEIVQRHKQTKQRAYETDTHTKHLAKILSLHISIIDELIQMSKIWESQIDDAEWHRWAIS